MKRAAGAIQSGGGSFVVISSCFGAEGAGEVTEVALRVFTVSEYIPLSC